MIGLVRTYFTRLCRLGWAFQPCLRGSRPIGCPWSYFAPLVVIYKPYQDIQAYGLGYMMSFLALDCSHWASFTMNNILTHQTILNLISFLHILNNICEMSFDLEWTTITYLSEQEKKKTHHLYALEQRMEDAFPAVHFHASQVGYSSSKAKQCA